MKLRAQVEGLAVIATIAAVLAKDTLVAITGNRTVNAAGAGATSIGRLVVPSKTVNGQGTVETRFKEFLEIKTAGIIAAGEFVKLAAVDGTTGESRVVKFTPGTDDPTLLYGICWNGAASGGTAEVLAY